MIDFSTTYKEFLRAIEDKMLEYVKVIPPVNLYEPFEYLISGGGKRIRPVLAMICCGAVGNDPYIAIDSGVAVEILHNFTLVHDDIMDESRLRRGRDTVHIKWDVPTGILVGDVMVGYAYNLLPKANEHIRSQEIISAFTNGLIEVCEGQAYDMEFNRRIDITIEDYFNMIDKKTAKLLETSAIIGGLTGNGNVEEINALRLYAHNLGIAFQLQDDLLDLTAEQAELGKTIGQDIIEGKKTYMILRAVEKSSIPEDIALLEEFYKNNGLTINYIPKIKEMFERLEIFKVVKEKYESYYNEAQSCLGILKDNEYTQMLNWVVDKLRNRNS
jgi:geranylgeranyl diphosphate synthase, type II